MEIVELYLKNLENKYIVPLLVVAVEEVMNDNTNEQEDHVVLSPSDYGYLEEKNNDYSKVFQTKFTSNHGLKLKFNQKDVEYIKYINKKIEEMNYYLFCFNVLFPIDSVELISAEREKKIKLCKLFCPELLEKITEANNLKFHPIKKKLFDIKINGVQSRDDVNLMFLGEKKLLSLNNLEPLYTKQQYLQSNQLISIIEMLKKKKSKQNMFIARKLIVTCLFPFLIPKEIQFLFWKDDDLSVNEKFLSNTQFFMSKFKVAPIKSNWDFRFENYQFTVNEVKLNIFDLVNNIHKRQTGEITNFNVGGSNERNINFDTMNFF